MALLYSYGHLCKCSQLSYAGSQPVSANTLQPPALKPETRQASRWRRHPPGQCPRWRSSLRAFTNYANSKDVPTKTPGCCERRCMFLCLVFCDFIHRIKFLHWQQCFNLFGNIGGKTSATAAKLLANKDTSYDSMLHSIKWLLLRSVFWNSEGKNPGQSVLFFEYQEYIYILLKSNIFPFHF